MRQPAWISVLIGAAAKILASTVTYPYQVVKSRLQQRDPIVLVTEALNSTIMNNGTAATGGDIAANNSVKELVQPRYTGTIDCVRKIWR